jgi:murein L,D-transpeptidase YafK
VRALETALLALLVSLGAERVSAAAQRPVPPRLARAQRAKVPRITELLGQQRLGFPPHRVFIRIFKRDQQLELWAAGKTGPFRRLASYRICAASGGLGPKRRAGDLQVPEGVYHVTALNPWSAYHLSLGINYPNASDRVLGRRGSLGGAIMIHGDCVSIGCVAIRNDQIEEVFVAAEAAHRSGQRRIPVHIFPTRLDAAGRAFLAARYASEPKRLAFWSQLAPIYDHFERLRLLPDVRIDAKGRYGIVR